MEKNIKEFVSKNIDLPKELWVKAKRRVENIEDVLSTINEIHEIRKQGSFSRKTIIRPKKEENEFDIDITANFKGEITNDKFRNYAKSINERLINNYDLVSKFGSSPSKATQVRFNKHFHIDVVPLAIDSHENEYVYDVLKFNKELSNPLKFTKAFNHNAKKHPDNSLRDAIKIIKYIRDLHELKGIKSILFDIYYFKQDILFDEYNKNVIALLEKFDDMPHENEHPFCNGEKIRIEDNDIKHLNILKKEIKNTIDKFKANDFTGLKKIFKKYGAVLASASGSALAIATSIAGVGGHVSGG